MRQRVLSTLQMVAAGNLVWSRRTIEIQANKWAHSARNFSAVAACGVSCVAERICSSVLLPGNARPRPLCERMRFVLVHGPTIPSQARSQNYRTSLELLLLSEEYVLVDNRVILAQHDLLGVVHRIFPRHLHDHNRRQFSRKTSKNG